MRRTHRTNIELIKTVANRLGPLIDKVVFLGGAATGLLITDTAAPDVMELAGGIKIHMVTSPYFLATKIEAFYGHGNGDYMASHDMEDIIALIDGRPDVIDEIRSSPSELRTYLAETFQSFLKDERFLESLPGHLPPDQASQGRVAVVKGRIEGICEVRD